MRERRPDSAEEPVLIAIDHLFVGNEEDGLAQAVYDALGGLDAAWPEALAPISAADLALLVACARDVGESAVLHGREQLALQGAARRVGHVLERMPHGVVRRVVSDPRDEVRMDADPPGGSVFTLEVDVG